MGVDRTGLSQALTTRRDADGTSVREAADRAGLPVTTYAEAERGHREVSIPTLMQLAKYLERELTDFLVDDAVASV